MSTRDPRIELRQAANYQRLACLTWQEAGSIVDALDAAEVEVGRLRAQLLWQGGRP